MRAVSVVPPPTSTIRLPIGSLIGRPEPIAAARGCSIRRASAAPALRAASVTALLSTAVIADGTQMTTLGLLKRDTPTRSSKSRIILCVTSKSVIAPWRRGLTATIYAGVLPIICHASSPIARTSLVFSFSAMTEGSLRTMPLPLE